MLKHVQHQHFPDVIQRLSDDKTPETQKSTGKGQGLQRLNPFLDNGLLRVGGRLSKSSLPESMKYPILLPKRSYVTTLLIRHVHVQLAHAGRNHVMSKLRERFWILSINSAVRHVIYKCIECRRRFRRCSGQQMADLPSDRVEPAPPFTFTGVDFFGPFLIKEGRRELKRYGALFTCLSSRAVHLESANTLETDSFLNALRRFIARRGPVSEIRCDNATNFVGAARELQEAVKEIDHDKIQKQLLHQHISWKFNPPSASHMGGVWERQIKSTRKIMSSLLHNHGTRIDDEGFRTLLCEVESIINSRPLTSISNDADDYHALSPAQILTLKPAMLPPPGILQPEDVYARKRWKRVQYLACLFWSRWKREYLVNLQARQKWLFPQRNMEIGDIVVVQDDNTQRFHWPLARVVAVEADSSGAVRSVKLQTQKSELRRPVHKLVLLLPVEEQAQ